MKQYYKDYDISNIVEYKNNARLHSSKNIKELMRSIEKFGYLNPILIDENNTIIAGHCRFEALKRLKYTKIDVVKISGLTDEERKAYILADNKLALNSEWDLDLLKNEMQELLNTGFDLSLTGFDDDEIGNLLSDSIADFDCSDDVVAEDTAEECSIKIGDVIQLGDHILVVGDSTDENVVSDLLKDKQCNLMITDPPYGVKYDASWRGCGSEREKNPTLLNDDNADWEVVYKNFKGDVAYVWHASSFTDVVMRGLKNAGFEIKQQIIWNKNLHALSRCDYQWKHEPCWYAVREGAKRKWYGKRDKKTIWDVDNVMFEEEKIPHPTQKPVQLYINSILNHTKKGEYVFDPFAGSGTLLSACEKTERKALMIEMDVKFANIIVKRYENLKK